MDNIYDTEKDKSRKTRLNSYPISQELIDDILNNELKEFDFPVKPVYNPRIRNNGITKAKMHSWGQLYKSVDKAHKWIDVQIKLFFDERSKK